MISLGSNSAVLFSIALVVLPTLAACVPLPTACVTIVASDGSPVCDAAVTFRGSEFLELHPPPAPGSETSFRPAQCVVLATDPKGSCRISYDITARQSCWLWRWFGAEWVPCQKLTVEYTGPSNQIVSAEFEVEVP